MRAAFETNGVVFADGRVTPTVSVGVAAVSPAAFSLQEMLGFADLALYQSKASGRNCVRAIGSSEGDGNGIATIADAPPLKPMLVSSIRRSRSKAS